MSTFLYFVEGREAFLSKPEFAALGLAYVTDDGSPPYNGPIGRGPSGDKGLLVCDQKRLGEFQPVYRETEQTWRKLPPRAGQPQCWVGFYNAARPTPASLARELPLDGPTLRLADGHDWRAPLVRMVLGLGGEDANAVQTHTALPRYVDCDDLGRPIPGEVLDDHRDLAARCDAFWQAWLAGITRAIAKKQETFSIDHPTIVEDAAYVLGKNYRLGLVEIAMLRLFTHQAGAREAAAVLEAACECELAQALLLQKKTASPAASST